MKRQMNEAILIHCLSEYHEKLFLMGRIKDTTRFYSVRYEVEEVYRDSFLEDDEEELEKYIIKGKALHHKCDFYGEVAYNGQVMELIIGDDEVRDFLKELEDGAE